MNQHYAWRCSTCCAVSVIRWEHPSLPAPEALADVVEAHHGETWHAEHVVDIRAMDEHEAMGSRAILRERFHEFGRHVITRAFVFPNDKYAEPDQPKRRRR